MPGPHSRSHGKEELLDHHLHGPPQADRGEEAQRARPCRMWGRSGQLPSKGQKALPSGSPRPGDSGPQGSAQSCRLEPGPEAQSSDEVAAPPAGPAPARAPAGGGEAGGPQEGGSWSLVAHSSWTFVSRSARALTIVTGWTLPAWAHWPSGVPTPAGKHPDPSRKAARPGW